MKRLNQSGSHIIGFALLVVALGLVAFAGYTVSHRNQSVASTASTVSSKAVVPTAIKNSGDLQQTAQALDSASSQLSSNLDDSSLNADLSSML
jgi:hypothetical protein